MGKKEKPGMGMPQLQGPTGTIAETGKQLEMPR